MSSTIKFVHTTRANVEPSRLSFDVSSYSEQFAQLSPFNRLGNIPHPCDKRLMCMSVECIWQGSKVFDAACPRPDYFVLFGKKSPNKNKGKRPIGTWIGQNQITSDVGEARRLVYIPAYRWTLEHRLKRQVDKLLFIASVSPRRRIYLYDVDWNGCVDNPAPLSHASVLVEYLNEKYNDKEYMASVRRNGG